MEWLKTAGVHYPTVIKAGSMKSGYQQGHVPSQALSKILPFLFPVSAGGCSQEACIWVKKQQLELDMNQWTASKSGKEYVKAVYCHPAYLTYMQSTSCEKCQAG